MLYFWVVFNIVVIMVINCNGLLCLGDFMNLIIYYNFFFEEF